MFLVGGILDHWDFLRGTEFHQRPGATNKSRGCSTAFLRHPFLACLRVSKKNLLSLHKIRLHELGPDDSTFETPQFWILQSPCVIRSLVISWSWCCWLPRRRLRWINSRFFVGHVLSAPPNQKKDAPQMGVDLLTKWLGPVNPKQTLHWSPSGVFIPAVFLWSWGKKSNKKEVLFVGILMFCIMPLGTGNWDLFFWRGLWKRSHPWKPNMTLENPP